MQAQCLGFVIVLEKEKESETTEGERGEKNPFYFCWRSKQTSTDEPWQPRLRKALKIKHCCCGCCHELLEKERRAIARKGERVFEQAPGFVCSLMQKWTLANAAWPGFEKFNFSFLLSALALHITAECFFTHRSWSLTFLQWAVGYWCYITVLRTQII